MKSVLVIGGGFAGLSSAVSLSQKGYSVSVIEQRRILGGRAYSIPSGSTLEWVDNGQHALLAGFHETRRFFRTLGTEHLVKFQNHFEVIMIGENQRIRIKTFPFLPAPLHLGMGILCCQGLSCSDRFRLLKAGLQIGLTPSLPDNLTVTEWMNILKQPESLRHLWWYPLSTAALNEVPHRASARLFLKVMKDTFVQSARNSPFGMMTVSLGELYTRQAALIIQSAGGEINLSSPVRHIHFSKTTVQSIELQDGRSLTADYYISAVPPGSLSKLLPTFLQSEALPFSALKRLSGSPIISIHLWFDRPIMEEDFVGLVGSPIHWVFNKSRLWTKEDDNGGAISCTISGAHDLIDKPPTALSSLAHRELKRFFPMAGKAQLLKTRLIKEREATYSCTPEAEKMRLPHQTPFSNFFIAGDWTRTGLPATIESAVSSGHQCAGLVAAKR